MPEFRSVKEVEDRQGEIKLRLEELNVEFQGREFTDEARKEWNDLGEERDANKKLAKELRVREAVVDSLADNEDATERSGPGFNAPRPPADMYDLLEVRKRSRDADHERALMHEHARRAVESEGTIYPHPEIGRNSKLRLTREDVQQHVERLLQKHGHDGELARMVLTTGSPTYRRAFGKALTYQPLTSDEQRALSLAGSGGGFAIPFTLDPSIIPTSNSVVNPVRALARIETITGSNTWQGVSSGAIVASRVAEATAPTDNSPTLAQPQATVTKAHAFVPFSHEVGQDWGALESEMARLLQDAKDDEEAAAFVTGVGTTVNPQGFVTGTTNTVAASSGLTITAANLYALEAALPPRFRANEQFVANRGIYNVIRGIDTGGGAALWLYLAEGLNTQAPSPGNTGAILLGRGAWEASAMQATVVNATKVVVVGDFSYFLVVDRLGMTVELIQNIVAGATPGPYFPSGQRGIYAYWRNTSKVLDANAFRALTGTT